MEPTIPIGLRDRHRAGRRRPSSRVGDVVDDAGRPEAVDLHPPGHPAADARRRCRTSRRRATRTPPRTGRRSRPPSVVGRVAWSIPFAGYLLALLSIPVGDRLRHRPGLQRWSSWRSCSRPRGRVVPPPRSARPATAARPRKRRRSMPGRRSRAGSPATSRRAAGSARRSGRRVGRADRPGARAGRRPSSHRALGGSARWPSSSSSLAVLASGSTPVSLACVHRRGDTPARAFAADTLAPPTGLGATGGVDRRPDLDRHDAKPTRPATTSTGRRRSGGPYSQIATVTPRTTVTLHRQPRRRDLLVPGPEPTPGLGERRRRTRLGVGSGARLDAPTIGTSVISKTTQYLPGSIKPSASFYVYANVTDRARCERRRHGHRRRELDQGRQHGGRAERRLVHRRRRELRIPERRADGGRQARRDVRRTRSGPSTTTGNVATKSTFCVVVDTTVPAASDIQTTNGGTAGGPMPATDRLHVQRADRSRVDPGRLDRRVDQAVTSGSRTAPPTTASRSGTPATPPSSRSGRSRRAATS